MVKPNYVNLREDERKKFSRRRSMARCEGLKDDSSELAGADGAATDDDGEKETNDSELEIAESCVDSSQPKVLKQFPMTDTIGKNWKDMNERSGNANHRREEKAVE
uniref:Uncharacterized protein n=1 Tax=Cucumis sativus TaxID=3659 RepID=A0A0A0KQR8_CUCSA